jgi:LacI family transcriptional regulator
MSRIRQVALIYDAKLPYDVKVMTGVAAYLRAKGNWDVYIEENALKDQQLPDLRRWKGDGIIADFDDPDVAAQVKVAGITTVAFGGGYGWYDPASAIPYVFTNNEAVARLAAEHLLNRGFRSFAFCGYPSTPINGWCEERAKAFAGRIERAEFLCECYRGRHRSSRNWPALRDALAEWLNSLAKPVGLMAATDKRARQVLDVCRFAGLRVPDDVAVVGVDNDEMLCQLSNPSLTSVEQGARRIGYEAAALLDQMMSGKRRKRVRYVVDPEGVIARRSTDILAVQDEEVAQALRIIRRHACDGITPEEVTRRVARARSTLELRFRNELGSTVFAEIRRVQLEQAERYIRETELPLKQIASQCGFRSVQHMTTLFRRHFGHTPAQHRRETRI